MATINLKFYDFKKLAKNRRIYYFLGENFYDFVFVSDGILVKTILSTAEVSNPQQFFSDPMFYNSMQLTFRVMSDETNPLEFVSGIKQPVALSPLTAIQDEEVKQINIQKEGVE